MLNGVKKYIYMKYINFSSLFNRQILSIVFQKYSYIFGSFLSAVKWLLIVILLLYNYHTFIIIAKCCVHVNGVIRLGPCWKRRWWRQGQLSSINFYYTLSLMAIISGIKNDVQGRIRIWILCILASQFYK